MVTVLRPVLEEAFRGLVESRVLVLFRSSLFCDVYLSAGAYVVRVYPGFVVCEKPGGEEVVDVRTQADVVRVAPLLFV